MYHHQQQQGPQPFSNGPRPHHQPHPNQHQNCTPSDLLSRVIGFQFPRPTQLPDELESALAIRSVRDMDHRLIDHKNPLNQHQNQASGTSISQHETYGAKQVTLTSDSQPGHQQGIDWSSYQPPAKLFASPPPSTSHQSQRHQGPQQPENSHTGPSIPSWTAPISDSISPQVQYPHSGGSGGGVDVPGLYTPESAGSILASFGLSNEDLEVLSHYPDDQLTPDTLPFILRDIQINKSGNQKTGTSSTNSFSCSIHDMPLQPSHSSTLAHFCSAEVPSLLTITQTAGKVIDYGHASRAKDEDSAREFFKREPLSNERTVTIYPSTSKMEKAERHQVHMEHTEASKHGDCDYRRTNSDHGKSSQSPGRELTPSKSRNLDQDYRHKGLKPRSSSETRSNDCSKRFVSSSYGTKTLRSSKKLPTPTMISDFSAVSPKVYPHTCSLCHTQCDQEKDWVDHINTVNHTAACRDLRNKYPHWKPLPSWRGHGSQALWDPKDHSPSHSISRSLSGSPTPGSPHSKHGVGVYTHRSNRKLYSLRHHLRYPHHTERGHRSAHHHGSSRSPSKSHRIYASSREHRPDRREGEPSGGTSRSGGKRLHNDTNCHPTSKHGLSQFSTKTGVKNGTKMPKTSAKAPLSKKKKKMVTQACQDSSVADRLVYLSGIPSNASEQEVANLVGSFGRINNVILMPCSEEESKTGDGQKASICMVKAEDAQALANTTSLSIRDKQITASIAKKPKGGQPADTSNSKPASRKEKTTAAKDSGGKATQKMSNEKGMLLITGLPENSWSEGDIIRLMQPFGTPTDIILATQIGKVLVSVPDIDIAEEIVKVHTFIPAKINDSELKIIQVKQRIGISTPVALYNLLMGSVDPLESMVPVSWNTLLVIGNVPNTPSGSSEVQKLVRRFGTVIKTLVLNNMVICEMATAAMALSVYKRFQTFPCIIHNNPLFFSRKPDPKADKLTKVITAYLSSSEDTPKNGMSSQTVAAAEEGEVTPKKRSAPDGMENAIGTEKKMKHTVEMVSEHKALGENRSKDKIKKKGQPGAAPNTRPKAAMDTDARETSTVQTVVQTTVEDTGVNGSKTGKDKARSGEKTKQSSTDAASTFMPELPKVTQQMVNALLEECRTRTTSHINSSNTASSSCGVKWGSQGESLISYKAAEDMKELTKSHTEEMKKQEREVRKEKEAKARGRKDRERRTWDKEERARRENEKWEEQRREWDRKERKRANGDGLSGSKSSCRSEGYKQSWRCGQSNNNKAVEEGLELPFNMTDFVTVDEVGDVTNLPCSPSPGVVMETTEGKKDAVTSDPQVTCRATPMEVAMATTTSDAAVTREKLEVLECETVSAVLILNAAAACVPTSQTDSPPSQTHKPSYRQEAAEKPPEYIDESTSEIEQLSLPAWVGSPPEDAPVESLSNSPATGQLTAEGLRDKTKESNLNQNQVKVWTKPSKTEEEEEMQDREIKQPEVSVADKGKQERLSEPKTELSAKKLQNKTPMSTDYGLLPFDPSKPIGMEFLVPKTGFFCKVCNRFFSGTKEVEINHCKTVKHYKNLQKYLQTTTAVNDTAKPY
ncbi:zinc finger protein 638-like isoform X2 [Echeneis naucrates]|uniref:zinc finger protein 638-like isoform X2 n=1 Tax=Echeneis naucrates TaxID=173247 RepID=UPI001114124C|nr:zinc finger protein 638-like isoform X2 [Echeneis naucrates]